MTHVTEYETKLKGNRPELRTPAATFVLIRVIRGTALAAALAGATLGANAASAGTDHLVAATY